MFNFQREVVLNNLNDVKAFATSAFRIEGSEYNVANVDDKKVYFTNPIAGKVMTIGIKAHKLLGKHVQIIIEYSSRPNYRGDFGAAMWKFRKPLVLDLVLSEDLATAGKQVWSAVSKVISAPNYPLTAHKSGNETYIDGKDCYIYCTRMTIYEITCDNSCQAHEDLKRLYKKDYKQNDEKYVDDYSVYISNREPFGTYDYLIQNLRLPTYENLRFASASVPELPIFGQKYVQFSFSYTVSRQNIGGVSVVGQKVASNTLHTFYVLESLADSFKKSLKDLVDFEELKRYDSNHKFNVTVLPAAEATKEDVKSE